jgi:hypothetical protein
LKERHDNEILIVMREKVYNRKMNIGLHLTIGLDKSINKYLTFFIEGRISHNILNNTLNKEIYSPNRFTNRGLGLGVNYKFLN